MIPIEKNEIQKLCVRHKVEKLYLFGSATNKSFTSRSDIDLLVSFKNIELVNYFMNYITLKEKFEKLFGREIDLVEEQTLKNPVLINSINKNKKLIYDERILKWLYDIDFALIEIEPYFDKKEKDFHEYKKNIMLKRAIE